MRERVDTGRLHHPDGRAYVSPAGVRPPSWVLSYGMGVDSTALLVRWLLEPATRPFASLEDLLVVTADTGDEWGATLDLVDAHVLPLLRAHRVRFAQVARAGPAAADGVVVLSDSTAPSTLVRGGGFALSAELLRAGTVPQTASGQRRCSQKSKAAPLDAFIAAATGGAAFTHVLGFEVSETTRVARDRGFSSARRRPAYPLVEWGWDRAACERYLAGVFSVRWPKSACVMCPFVFSPRDPQRTTSRFATDPAEAARALLLEHVAVALNPNVPLFGTRRAVDVVRAAGLTDVLDQLEASLAAAEHALYEVRRVVWPRQADPAAKGRTDRSVRTLARGSRVAMAEALAAAAARRGVPVESAGDSVPRAWLARRGAGFPAWEHLLVAAPAGVADKARPGFDRAWAAVTGQPAAA